MLFFNPTADYSQRPGFGAGGSGGAIPSTYNLRPQFRTQAWRNAVNARSAYTPDFKLQEKINPWKQRQQAIIASSRRKYLVNQPKTPYWSATDAYNRSMARIRNRDTTAAIRSTPAPASIPIPALAEANTYNSRPGYRSGGIVEVPEDAPTRFNRVQASQLDRLKNEQSESLRRQAKLYKYRQQSGG